MKSLIFSAPMVLALLAGRKTQTRRIIKPQPPHSCSYKNNGNHTHALCFGPNNECVPPTARSTDHRLPAPHKPGDTLYVRETLRLDPANWWTYAADGSPLRCPYGDIAKMNAWIASRKNKTQSSMFMPAWASRLHLTITDVRVQRVQEISEEDARAEGIADGGCLSCGRAEPCGCDNPNPNARDTFANLWFSLHGPASWAANPWCWCYTFEVKKIGGAA